MTQPHDITGQRFGRLVASEAGYHRGGRTAWLCLCDCGNQKVVPTKHLTCGAVVSCGCYHRENHTTHGKHKSPEYSAWRNILSRCLNPKNPKYKDYGARGIAVCAEWQHSFVAFLSHAGERPSQKHSIDRIDNDGNYEPGNVRWTTMREQLANRRCGPGRSRRTPA